MSSTGRQSGSGVKCRAKLGHRRGPHRRQDRISAAPSLFPVFRDVHFLGCCNQSPHQRLKATEMRCLQPGGRAPDPGVGRGHPSLPCGPRAASFPPASRSFSGAPAVHPLAQGCSLQFLPFSSHGLLSVSGSPPRLLRTLFTGLRTQLHQGGVPQWLSRQSLRTLCEK